MSKVAKCFFLMAIIAISTAAFSQVQIDLRGKDALKAFGQYKANGGETIVSHMNSTRSAGTNLRPHAGFNSISMVAAIYANTNKVASGDGLEIKITPYKDLTGGMNIVLERAFVDLGGNVQGSAEFASDIGNFGWINSLSAFQTSTVYSDRIRNETFGGTLIYAVFLLDQNSRLLQPPTWITIYSGMGYPNEALLRVDSVINTKASIKLGDGNTYNQHVYFTQGRCTPGQHYMAFVGAQAFFGSFWQSNDPNSPTCVGGGTIQVNGLLEQQNPHLLAPIDIILIDPFTGDSVTVRATETMPI